MAETIISQEMALLIEKSEIDYMINRMQALQERPGNPMGVEMQSFGGCVALYSKGMPWPQFNTVKGLHANDVGRLEEIIDFYTERGTSPQFEIVPANVGPELMRALAQQGFYQSGFHASLYGGLTDEPLALLDDDPHHHAVRVRELTADEFDLYGEIHCLGTGLSISGKEHVASNNRILYNREGWTFLIAYYHDQPAGVGVMYTQDNVASLTFATVLPSFRNQGIHRALLNHRIKEAVRQNCLWVVGQAAYASTSHRNMERAGLRLGYTRATWKSGVTGA